MVPSTTPQAEVTSLAIQVAGEGWIGDLLDWFPAPQWMQVYDRRATTPVPVVLPPSGGTLPLVPDPTGVQVPAVVLGQQPTILNAIPPPPGPGGIHDIPTGPMADDPEEQVALEDWFEVAREAANVWGQTRIFNAPSQFVSAPPVAASAPAVAQVASGLPTGMYYDKHGHLVHRRRRRRPCITQTDLSLAWQVSNLPNNANVRMFLAKCVH